MKFSNVEFSDMPRLLPRPDLGDRATELLDELTCWWFDKSGTRQHLTVAVGYITDGPSVPKRLSGVTPYTHRQLRPAIIHDWICEYMPPPWNWTDAADLFADMLKREGVGWVRRKAMANAVRLHGWFR